MPSGGAMRPKNAVSGVNPLKNMVFLGVRCASVAKNGWLKIVQKKIKKKLTPLVLSARLLSHTVNNNTLNTLQMKLKATLIAAATLAVGVISSQAQVYSQNIVGYVSLATTATNQFACFANPLDNGTNNLTSLFPTAPNQTVVELWNGTSFQAATKSFGNWNTNLNIPVGTGFFIKYPVSAGLVTNTFAGNVVVQTPNAALGAPSGTNTISLPNIFALVGSPFPVSGQLTDSGDGTLNIGSVLVNQSVVEVWNGTSFQAATKSFGNWNTNLPIAVGQGFFVKSKNATNWVQSLTLQ